MRHACLAVLVFVSGCGRLLPAQTLASPCVGMPATDGGACPPCSSDSDCVIASNPCLASASCVPKAGNWAVIAIGCDVEHAPPVASCRCVESVCAAR